MIGMSHQQRAKSWLSLPHTLKDFVIMQDKDMTLKQKYTVVFVMYIFIFPRHTCSVFIYTWKEEVIVLD